MGWGKSYAILKYISEHKDFACNIKESMAMRKISTALKDGFVFKNNVGMYFSKQPETEVQEINLDIEVRRDTEDEMPF